MKKLSLICITILLGMGLSACESDSNSHKKKTQTAETSVSSSVSASQNVQPSPATTQTANQATAPSLASQSGSAITEDQARAMLGGANGDLTATRTDNGWLFSGDGYTATVDDNGSISHN